jgi:methyl-accepting chemotaxis protein
MVIPAPPTASPCQRAAGIAKEEYTMRWFTNLHALPKLVLSFGLLTLLNAMTGILALNRLNEESDRVVTAYSKDIDGMAQVDSVASAKLGLARLTRDAIIKINNKEAVAQDIAAFNSLADATRKNIEQSQISFKGEEGAAQIAEITQLFPRYVELCQAILTKVQAGDARGAVSALAEVEPVAKTLNTDTAEAAAAKRRLAARTSAMSQDSFRNTRTVLVSLIAACVIVGIGMSFWIGKLFSDPLRKAVGLLREVAEGDLTGRLDLRTTDEVGEMAKALNEAMERMRNTLQDVSRASEGVNTASRELTSSSELIADGAQQQAASLEETAASLEQITATVRQSADNAREASVLASSSRESAEQGGHIVSDAVTAMGEINTASKKISDIISTVDAGRGAGPRLRGCGLRGAQPGAAQRRVGQGDQGAHRRHAAQGEQGHRAGQPLRRDAAKHHPEREAGQRDCRRYRHCLKRAEHRHRTGESGHGADGRRDANQFRADERSRGYRGVALRPVVSADGVGKQIQDREDGGEAAGAIAGSRAMGRR